MYYMKFKRNIFTSLLIKHWIVFLLIIFMSLPAGACTIPIEVLGSRFVEELSPEQALVIVDSLPTCDGYVSHLYMKLQGAVVEGLRIDEIAIEARDVYFNPPVEWKEKLRPKEVSTVLFEARLLEEDVNNALKKYELKDKRWSNFKFDLRNGKVVAIAVYEQPLLLFKLNILAKLIGELEVVGGNKIYLKNCKLYADGFRLPEHATQELIEKVQPLLDFDKFIFPVQLDSVSNDDKSILIFTKDKPEPFESSFTWTYSSFSENAVSQSAHSCREPIHPES